MRGTSRPPSCSLRRTPWPTEEEQLSTGDADDPKGVEVTVSVFADNLDVRLNAT
ncbi:MAG: hypothetical protein J0H88_03105 [Sphingomonadales bacterium]|nr:hypothetical protein [Sphingomonadales bacterium]